MKQLFKFSGVCLLAAALTGCSQVEESIDASTPTISGEQITISAQVGNDSKVTVGDNWALSWAKGDNMLLISTQNGDSSTLEMDQYDASVSTFTGTLPSGCTTFRLATPAEAFSSSSTTCTVDISDQQAGLCNTYMVSTEVVSDFDEAQAGAIAMSHVGAAATLKVTVSNAPSSSDLVITAIKIHDVPTSATLDMTKGIDDAGFYSTTTTGDICISFSSEQEEDTDADSDDDSSDDASSGDSNFTTESFQPGLTFDDSTDDISGLEGIAATESSFEVKFNILPFSEDEKIVVDFTYTNKIAGNVAVITKEIAGSGTFSRATYNTIATSIDFNDLYETLIFDDVPEPNTTTATVYAPSALTTYYYPITLKSTSSTSSGATPSTSQKSTRILEYMVDFEPDYSATNYYNSINKYGSRTDKMGTATGRYHTEKINGRWWIVDPEGYLNIQRGLNSITHAQGNEITGAWASKWGAITPWLTDVFEDFKELGFNATGAFTKDSDCGYSGVLSFSATAENPLSVAPSMGFLSAFRTSSTYNTVTPGCYPDGSSDNDDLEVCLPFYDGWDSFCEYYVEKEVAAYEADVNTFGFFSDNELQWNGYTLDVLSEILKISDTTNPAYVAAAAFMTENNATVSSSAVTTTLSQAFAGLAARKYYEGVRKALDKLEYKILYLGTRLHGTPKQIDSVIQAAGDNCDVISINYYSNWSVANSGSWDAQSVSSFVANSWETAAAPYLISEFYVKGADMGTYGMSNYVTNTDGAGWLVTDQLARGCWYQHFTLGLLESTHCVGWHWFRYQDDESANRGFYDRNYNQWETLARYAKALNYNIYSLIDYFDSKR